MVNQDGGGVGKNTIGGPPAANTDSEEDVGIKMISNYLSNISEDNLEVDDVVPFAPSTSTNIKDSSPGNRMSNPRRMSADLKLK